ncbi:MAG: NADH-quinone oxidoreductase subunit NuoF [Myxococcota bacterium]
MSEEKKRYIPEVKIFSRTWKEADSHKLEVYKRFGGYKAAEKALKMEPSKIVEEVKVSNLRGRGGAGFPAGVKWGFIPKDNKKPVYLIVNADEGEPGTFKDRYIMEKSPHLLLEGIIISCYAIRSNRAFIYIRGEFTNAIKRLNEAIAEAKRAGYLGKNIFGAGYELEAIVHPGAGAYICGEETALIESLEGKKGQPRLKPPFPAAVGVFNCPTIVNNVETISAVPAIIEHGGKWFAGLGPERNGGTKLYCVSGMVNRPGVYELLHYVTLRELIYDVCGGIPDGKKLKGVIPGGSSTPVLLPNEIDVQLDFDSVQKAGSMLGSAGVVVLDETTCPVRVMRRLARFYAHESCGQCTPCRDGTGWMARVIERVENGGATIKDVDDLFDIAIHIEGRTICPLGDAAAWPMKNFVKKFREEFERHIKEGGCYYPKDKERVFWSSPEDAIKNV